MSLVGYNLSLIGALFQGQLITPPVLNDSYEITFNYSASQGPVKLVIKSVDQDGIMSSISQYIGTIMKFETFIYPPLANYIMVYFDGNTVSTIINNSNEPYVYDYYSVNYQTTKLSLRIYASGLTSFPFTLPIMYFSPASLGPSGYLLTGGTYNSMVPSGVTITNNVTSYVQNSGTSGLRGYVVGAQEFITRNRGILINAQVTVGGTTGQVYATIGRYRLLASEPAPSGLTGPPINSDLLNIATFLNMTTLNTTNSLSCVYLPNASAISTMNITCHDSLNTLFGNHSHKYYYSIWVYTTATGLKMYNNLITCVRAK